MYIVVIFIGRRKILSHNNLRVLCLSMKSSVEMSLWMWEIIRNESDILLYCFFQGPYSLQNHCHQWDWSSFLSSTSSWNGGVVGDRTAWSGWIDFSCYENKQPYMAILDHPLCTHTFFWKQNTPDKHLTTIEGACQLKKPRHFSLF